MAFFRKILLGFRYQSYDEWISEALRIVQITNSVLTPLPL